MIVKNGRAAASLLAMGALVFSGSALATNGYFTHGVGTASKGMAGTGVGSNANMGAIMTASNPALGVFVDDGWEAGLSIFSPRRSYTAGPSTLNGGVIDLGGCSPTSPQFCLPSHTITPGKIDSGSEWFPIPYVAKNWSLQNGGNITGAFYGRGGMNTDWDDSAASAVGYFCGGNPFAGDPPGTGQGPYCAGEAGVDLMQAFLSVTYSAQVNENFAWGIGPVIALQSFEAKGVQTFAQVTKTCVSTLDPNTGACTLPTSLSDNGHDTVFGFGFTGGIWVGLSDSVSFGLSYTSKMSMDEFDDYADLYAEAGGFDIPASIKAGVSFLASDTLRINFDIENTAFDDTDSVGNGMINLFSCPRVPGGTDIESCLGGGNGAGFGWDDMTTYKIGFEWRQDETNTWRFGYSYGEQPIQDEDVLFNILAPGVMEQHVTFGLTHQTASGSAWDFSLMYAPEKSITGPSLFDPGVDFTSPQMIEVEMSQLEFEIAYSF